MTGRKRQEKRKKLIKETKALDEAKEDREYDLVEDD